ncbi:MAG: hypothetical protein GY765_20385 [bacterium]|nr:hypothetical protein [bacterium]
MKKDRLKPHVHKVKGRNNYGLYDILQGRFFKLSPSLSIPETREFLKEADLIFETEGEVPFKTVVDVDKYENNVSLRILQIKLEGHKEDTCWKRNPIGDQTAEMSDATISALYENLHFFSVEKIRIEAGRASNDKISAVLSRYNCQTFELRLAEGRKECERRYACRDCRVSTIGVKGAKHKKPSFCEYQL